MIDLEESEAEKNLKELCMTEGGECIRIPQDPQSLCCDGLKCHVSEDLIPRCVKDNSGNNYH